MYRGGFMGQLPSWCILEVACLFLFIRRQKAANTEAAQPHLAMTKDPAVLFPILAVAFVTLLLIASFFRVTCSGDGQMSATSIEEEQILRSIYERDHDHLVSGL